jgi:hypothetical protein
MESSPEMSGDADFRNPDSHDMGKFLTKLPPKVLHINRLYDFNWIIVLL